MQLLCGDADLRTKAKLLAIRKPGGRIGVDHRRIDTVHKGFDRLRIIAQDRIGVHRMMRIDVRDGLLQALHTLDGDLQIQILPGIILLARQKHIRIIAADDGVPVHLHAMCLQRRKDARDKIQPVPVDQQALCRIADTDALTFRIEQDRQHLIRVDVSVDVEDAVATTGLDDRNAGVFHAVGDQFCTSPRDQQIETVVHPHERIRRRMTAVLHQCNAVFIDPALPQRLSHPVTQHPIGRQRFPAAAQIADIAALQAKRSRIDADVGTRFINDADHADRDAALDKMQLSAIPLLQDPPAGIFQRRHLAHACADVVQPLFIQGEPVDERIASTRCARLFHILPVCLQDRFPRIPQHRCHPFQHRILLLCAQLGQRIARLFTAKPLCSHLMNVHPITSVPETAYHSSFLRSDRTRCRDLHRWRSPCHSRPRSRSVRPAAW